MTFAKRPHWAKAPFFRRPAAVPRGAVLLTFDDGPHPAYTPAVLERLARHGARAAFFLVGGRIAGAPGLPARIAAAGHALGNHTFAHERRGPFDFAGAAADVARCRALLPGATLFRPPFGRLTPGLWWAARRAGLTRLGWSLDSGDWRCRSEADARACAAAVLRRVRPGDAVLFHDDHRRIVPILDAVLPELEARGLLA